MLIGEAGIGKSTLWNYGLTRCRTNGAQVLVARPGQDDAHSPGQGLLDLFDPRHVPDGPPAPNVADVDLPVLDCCRRVLDHLRVLAGRAPVVIAIDDLPWLDDLTQRALRFAVRRLADAPVALLATARSWSPAAPAPTLPEMGGTVDLLEVGRMGHGDLRRIVVGALPSVGAPAATVIGDLAHGNPLFALELARSHGRASTSAAPGSALAALAGRVADLTPDTLRLARLLAVAGPSPLTMLAAAGGGHSLSDAVREGLAADFFSLDRDFVLRFAHPLIATAVLSGTNLLDRQGLHAALATTVTDPDQQALHLARATVDPDAAVADRLEATAHRLARRGAPRTAADLLADSARLTPPESVQARVRRTLADMKQRATAGDLPAALRLSTALLEQLEPGPLRAEVVTGQVVLEFTDAEQFLRAALDDVPDDGQPGHECLRGRLLGLLGWLVALHLGRLAEGLGYARAGLEIGRAQGDVVLIAQAASAVSNTSLLLGRRADELIAEARGLEGEVMQSQLALWPRVLQGRQQLWDGHLVAARTNLDAAYRAAVRNGAEIQRSYRLCDLAQVELAAGDLVQAALHADEGMEAAEDCSDERAISWLAYPSGVIAALRGDAATAERKAARLDWWAAHLGERPRSAMACHVRGIVAAADRDWTTGLDQLLAGLTILDGMGMAHPGPIPILPLAIQLASLAELPELVDSLISRMSRQCADLFSPWADAQLAGAIGQRGMLRDEPSALDTLRESRDQLLTSGYRLDGARVGCFAVAAGLRIGQRRSVLQIAEESRQIFVENGVRGWDAVSAELCDRIRGGGDGELTATEGQVVTLVAAGHRNREVATRLFVSESTVEAHLTRIYRKLGLRNGPSSSARSARHRLTTWLVPRRGR